MTDADHPLLSRGSGYGRAAAPVRHVHLGLGNFFRAHQAWYTEHAPDGSDWGIAAFSGRSASLATALGAQDDLYTLVTRSADEDRFEVISSVSATHAAGEHEQWLRYLADPQVHILSLTVTEAGYLRGPGGGLDHDSTSVRRDLSALQRGADAEVVSVPGRIVAGLAARRRADAGPLTLVPCDNLPDNGTVLADVVRDFAARLDPTLTAWIADSVEYATTVVDRITPRTTDPDAAVVAERTGCTDRAPVVTEPFAEWVLSGSFGAGRPGWDVAGAVFADDVTPYEQRKLWLLNGAHSLLAYAGPLLGHRTVADAIGDDRCLAWVEQWWDEAAPHLSMTPPEVETYRSALITRFTNSRIEHLLAQIAADGSVKLPVRIVPVLRAERSAGRMPQGAVRVLAAWMCHLRGDGEPVNDPDSAELITAAAGARIEDSVGRVLNLLDPTLPDDADLVTAVCEAMSER